MKTCSLVLASISCVLGFSTLQLKAQEAPNLSTDSASYKYHLIPDEFESVGGHALGLGNDGVAALSDQGSVRTNPAMLSFEKYYKVSAGYHWPTFGREFYQAGIVDSQTSPVAAGVMYTQGLSPFKTYDDPTLQTEDEKLSAFYDSPVKRRFVLGFGRPFGNVALGVNGQYVEWHDKGMITKGTSVGAGMAGLLTKTLRFGLSGENLSNKRVKDVSPTTYRAGLAYMMFNGDITLHLDLKRRERILIESFEKPEQMGTFSFTTRIQDLLRIMGAYSQSLDKEDKRASLSGGIALVNSGFSFSYLVRKPYLAYSNTHHAINLSMNMAL